ncbi:unnamed protein product [Phaedon cochleariae]|uniref:Uncharacterized protein n=1 Tax=Phaedon cochleariae TaxID=80249 RepID=A0A9P0DVM3_PHACE|nr:unnamed protein product [Phaedon cochleariae]
MAVAQTKEDIKFRNDIKQICTELLNEDFIDKVCTNFAEKYDSKIVKKLDLISESFEKLNETVNSNTKYIKNIEGRIAIMDQYAKRNTLRIYGVEEVANEVVLKTVATFIKSKLNIACSSADIDCAFRVGKDEKDSTKVRPILVNFVNNWKRTEIFRAKKLLKGSEFSIYEDLTKKNYELLIAAKKKYGNSQVWSAGGKIRVLHNTKTVTLNDMNDLL